MSINTRYSHLPPEINGRKLTRVMSSVGIYDEQPFAPGITKSYTKSGYVQLHSMHQFLGWAQDYEDNLHLVYIFGSAITNKKFTRTTYKTQEGANRAVLFHAKRLLQLFDHPDGTNESAQ